MNPEALAIDGEGDILLAGYATPEDSESSAYDLSSWVVKLDPEGAEQWVDLASGWGMQQVEHAIAADPSGAVLVAGHSATFSSGGYTRARKLSGDGDLLWEAADRAGSAHGIAADADGHVFVVGDDRESSSGFLIRPAR